MGIIITLSKNQFVNQFRASGEYGNCFTITALEKLYDYYDEVSDDTGEPIEFDIPAIASDWGEFDSLEELLDNHTHVDFFGLDEAGDEEEKRKIVLETLENFTTIFYLSNGHFLVSPF